MSLELLFVLGGVLLGFIIDRVILNNKKSSVLNKADSFLENAKNDASNIVKQAKKQANSLENDSRNLMSQKRKEISNIENRFLDKESQLDKKKNGDMMG